jgi:hypothetical protein
LLDSLLLYPPGTELTGQSLRIRTLASLSDKLSRFFEKDHRSATYRFQLSISVRDFYNCRVAIIDRGQQPSFVALQELSKKYHISDASNSLHPSAPLSPGSIPPMGGCIKEVKNDKAGTPASVPSTNKLASPAQIFLCVVLANHIFQRNIGWDGRSTLCQGRLIKPVSDIVGRPGETGAGNRWTGSNAKDSIGGGRAGGGLVLFRQRVARNDGADRRPAECRRPVLARAVVPGAARAYLSPAPSDNGCDGNSRETI